MNASATSTSDTEVVWHERRYQARVIAGGAAFELFSDEYEPGFTAVGRRFHRYVHASQLGSAGAALLSAGVAPVAIPVMPGADPQTVHRYSQNPRIDAGERLLVSAVRATAAVEVGTRMLKPLNRHQVARQLTSAPLVSGVCFREFDVAHLRTPEDLKVLAGDPDNQNDVAFAMRWKAIGNADYMSTDSTNLPGLASMPGRERRGSMVLGTGFLPSGVHLIPEFATANLADLPLTARAEILAYTPDGAEVSLFQYQPQTSVWDRMAGARHRDLTSRIPGLEQGRSLFRVEPALHAGLLGDHEGERVRVAADPGHGFSVFVRGAASRSPVARPRRFLTQAGWRGVDALVLGRNEEWVRLRLVRPDLESAMTTAATCIERAVYECWAPRAELVDPRTTTVDYANPA